jgi:hypothetical protein
VAQEVSVKKEAPKTVVELQEANVQYQVDIFGLAASVPNFEHLSMIHTSPVVGPIPFVAAKEVPVVNTALALAQSVAARLAAADDTVYQPQVPPQSLALVSPAREAIFV